MKQFILFVSLFMLPFWGISQKSLGIQENSEGRRIKRDYIRKQAEKYGLADLTQTKEELYIRIWDGNDIVEVAQGDKAFASYNLKVRSSALDTLYSKSYENQIAKKLIDALVENDVLTLSGNQKSGIIDGSVMIVEVATPDKYRMYYYFTPDAQKSGDEAKAIGLRKDANAILNVKEVRNTFVESLEPGGYTWGMTGLRIDKLLPEGVERSTLYKEVEEQMESKLGITKETSHTKFPMVFINRKPVFLGELNKLEIKEVKKLRVLNEEDPEVAFFGSNGMEYGVILVETYD